MIDGEKLRYGADLGQIQPRYMERGHAHPVAAEWKSMAQSAFGLAARKRSAACQEAAVGAVFVPRPLEVHVDKVDAAPEIWLWPRYGCQCRARDIRDG